MCRMPPRLALLTALVLPVVTTACMTPAPPAHVATPLVDVRADSVEQARSVGALADRRTTWIREVCPATREARPQVWIVDEISPFRGFPMAKETTGLHFDFLWIDRLYVRQDDLDGALTHELGHFLLGSAWDPLPPLLEEGLCDWLRIHVPDAVADHRREHLEVMAVLALGGELDLWTTREEEGLARRGRAALDFHTSLPDLEAVSGHSSMGLLFGRHDQRLAAHALGFVLMERLVDHVGLDGVLALCARAKDEHRGQVPLAWVYEAAELSGPQDLGRALLASMTADELELLVDRLADDLLDFLASSRGLQVGSREFVQWLDEANVVVALRASEHALRLLDQEAVGVALAGTPRAAPASAPAR